MNNENKTESKHDLRSPVDIAFDAIYDKARELCITDKLTIHQLGEMSRAVLNSKINTSENIKKAVEMVDYQIDSFKMRSTTDAMVNVNGMLNQFRKLKELLIKG